MVAANSSRSNATRMRIHHLLFWMAIASIWLAIGRVSLESWNELHSEFKLAPLSIEYAIYNVLFAGQILVLILAIFWRWRRIVTRIEPGEWFASVFAIDVLLSMANNFLSLVLIESNDVQWLSEHLVWLSVPYSVINVIWICIFGMLAWASQESRLWRFGYLLMVVLRVIEISFAIAVFGIDASQYVDALLTTYELLSGGTFLFLMITVSIGIFLEFLKRRSRRWTHWLGASICVLQTAWYGFYLVLSSLLKKAQRW